MSIKYAILGFLSWRPFTGYDLKKLFADSEAFHWSGNSNQIYRSLVQLHQQEWIDLEVKQQENLPPRKIYSITREGRAELRAWVSTAPVLPELKNQFVVQLAWADLLNAAELRELVDSYEHEVHMQLLMLQERQHRGELNPARTKREALLWELIADNGISLYKAELAWIRRVRRRVEPAAR